MLYIFWFLHQTTTKTQANALQKRCISFDSYIKPQLTCKHTDKHISCISFDSYIKPQLFIIIRVSEKRCISFDSYIKPQPVLGLIPKWASCISFDSYIKPQLKCEKAVIFCVVYLLIPTSNHNGGRAREVAASVVYLLIPTSNHNADWTQQYHYGLYIFWFLHQTTTVGSTPLTFLSCISFDSYIKPQPIDLNVLIFST